MRSEKNLVMKENIGDKVLGVPRRKRVGLSAHTARALTTGRYPLPLVKQRKYLKQLLLLNWGIQGGFKN